MNKEELLSYVLRQIEDEANSNVNSLYFGMYPKEAKVLLEYIKGLEKQAEQGEHYKHLYSEVKKQKDELEISYDILQKNNTTLVKQKEEAYKIADDYCKENQQLKKQKDDVIEYVKKQSKFIQGCDIYQPLNKDVILRILGETKCK